MLYGRRRVLGHRPAHCTRYVHVILIGGSTRIPKSPGIKQIFWWLCARARFPVQDDCLLLERDGSLWTFGGDEETGSGLGQDNSVWRFDRSGLGPAVAAPSH